MQASSAELIQYSEGSACPHLKGSNARTFCCKSVVTTVIFPVGIQSNIHVALIFTIKCLDTSKQAVNLSGQKKEVIVLYIKSATQWSKGYGNSFKMWLYVMPLWVFSIPIQKMDGKLQGTTTNCQTHSHKRLSSHLIYLPQFSAVVRHGSVPVGPVNLGAALSPRGWGGNGGPLKGWGHFLCLRALAGKIKCLHSVSPALFQMPPPPFKRPLWARMANEWFWVLAVSSFSLSLCHPQSPTPSVMQTPNLFSISTVNVKVQRQIYR